MKSKKLILLMIPSFLLAGCNGDDKKEKAPLNPKEVLYEYFLRDGSGDGKYKTVYTYDDKGNEIVSEGYEADLDSNDFFNT